MMNYKSNDIGARDEGYSSLAKQTLDFFLLGATCLAKQSQRVDNYGIVLTDVICHFVV